MKAIFRFSFVLIITSAITCFLSGGCNRPVNNYFVKEIDSISKMYVPDKREGICNVKIYALGKDMIISGETNLPEVKEAFATLLAKKKVTYLDSLMLLPDTSKTGSRWALVNLSTCNIRFTPSQDAELVSQSIMGTPVKILKKNGGWFLIQTPDNYLGWVDSEGIEPVKDSKYLSWKSSERLIYIEKFGDIYTTPDEKGVVSDIVAGCIVEKTGEEKGYFKVALADGRAGYIEKKRMQNFGDWMKNTKPEATKIIADAAKFMGAPYLWGGTSPKGMDCSGFIKTVFYLNGLILARDVSLMYRHGMEIKQAQNTDSLKKGDLLFFGSTRNGRVRATHVGMYIGNTEFIHESGMVRINSLDSARANYSKYRHDTFLGARRIIGEKPGAGFQPVADHSWYK